MNPSARSGGRPPARTWPVRLMQRCAVGCVLLITLAAARSHAQLIPGIEEWAAATVESGKSKWAGQRVPFPDPKLRPALPFVLRSELWPLTLHFDGRTTNARAQATLFALETAYALFSATGFTSSFGDGGEGRTGDHDLYLVDTLGPGVMAQVDATLPVSDLDAVRAFGLIDRRIPMANLATCTAQALAELMFFEIDPAEAASVRKSSAAYLAFLTTGQLGCDDDAERAQERPYQAAMDIIDGASGAYWLSLLGAREDRHTGIFLREMWQFARQHTWEGAGLRGSPDLFEVIAKAKELSKESLEDVAAELSIAGFLARQPGPVGDAKSDPRHALLMADVPWSALPEHIKPADPPIEALGSAYLLVRTDEKQPGGRLRVWSRGEYGVRWALTAAQLDADGRSISRVSIPTRDNPDGFLVVELDPRCRSVLISATNVSDGVPDADEPLSKDTRSIAFMLDR